MKILDSSLSEKICHSAREVSGEFFEDDEEEIKYTKTVYLILVLFGVLFLILIWCHYAF